MALYTNDERTPIQLNRIPQLMQDLPQWCMCAYEVKGNDNKLSKIPADLDGNYINPATHELYTFEEVKRQYEQQPNKFLGVSFSVKGSGLTIIDIDADDPDELTENERTFLRAGYVERSISGRGYHAVIKGTPRGDYSKIMYDGEGNAIEVFTDTGTVLMTGNVIENRCEIDNEANSNQFLDYLAETYKSNAQSYSETHTEPTANIEGYTPPELTSSSVVDLWFNTGKSTLKGRGITKRDLWERSDKAMQAYNNDLSRASYALVYELAYFLWDQPQELHDVLVNNPYWNEPDNYMKSNSKRLRRHDIPKAINERRSSGKVYQPKIELNKERETLLEQLENAKVINHIDQFINDIKSNNRPPAISTGFYVLDDVMSGGLREGLYVFGAISSLGKTTFVQQIADNIALNGKDVLFISLEMPRIDLMSKSISKETYLETTEKNGNTRNAKSAEGIKNSQKYQEYSDKEKTLIDTAVNRYKEYAGNISIYEAYGQIGHEDVKKLVEEYERSTGNTPVVVIDYLQILKPTDPRQTDKTNTDMAVNGLKQISRDHQTPVLAISSLNRESYNKPMTLSAFKESGAIEYSSDVLIGLDFTKMLTDRDNIDIEEEKAKSEREVTLTVLKNRNGRTGTRINYLFQAPFNYFEEQGLFKNRSKKDVVI